IAAKLSRQRLPRGSSNIPGKLASELNIPIQELYEKLTGKKTGKQALHEELEAKLKDKREELDEKHSISGQGTPGATEEDLGKTAKELKKRKHELKHGLRDDNDQDSPPPSPEPQGMPPDWGDWGFLPREVNQRLGVTLTKSADLISADDIAKET